MSSVAIPGWNAEGVLPPINPTQPVSTERSPYAVSLTDFILRFGQTAERRRALGGFLRYRAALHEVGLNNGFQWVDGSFLEHVEAIEARPPNDLDLVTFYRLPAGKSQRDLLAAAPSLFPLSAQGKQALKVSYLVDAYLVDLGSTPERLTRQSAYWYSVWSHRRNQIWKGFVQLVLAPLEDAAAVSTLASLDNSGPQL
jgi:hypothetical protein